MSTYIYNPGRADISFDDAHAEFASRFPRVVPGAIDNVSPARVARVLELAREAGLAFEPLTIDLDEYRRYWDAAGYETRYPTYYRGNQREKSLEHFIALKLLGLRATQVFIDVASENSPVPEIYWRLAGACTLGQDIMNPEGISGNLIGGDACAMPLPDEFADAASLTCSLEHFESDADVRLFAELGRVLKPGGSVCVVPFYVYEEDATQTDPQVSLLADVPFDEGTTIHLAEGWGNRHGRFYSPAGFKRRIVDPMSQVLSFRFFHLTNADQVDGTCYARFAFVATRRPLTPFEHLRKRISRMRAEPKAA
jgi:SAM-dependent methyltransferase